VIGNTQGKIDHAGKMEEKPQEFHPDGTSWVDYGVADVVLQAGE